MAKMEALDTSTLPAPFVFVLMPFKPDFDNIYQYGIKPACKTAGAYCERVDEQQFDGSILERIYNQIAKADVLIADMTGRNPNVYYETGYAHALGKRVILLTQNADDIPFDLKHHPHIVYGGDIKRLKPELVKRLRWCITHPTEQALIDASTLEYFINGKPLSQVPELDIMLASMVPHTEPFMIYLTINVNNTLDESVVQRCQIECLFPAELKLYNRSDQVISREGEGSLLVIDAKLDLLPGGWQSIPVTIFDGDVPHCIGNTVDKELPVAVTIRSDIGVRGYGFIIRFHMPKAPKAGYRVLSAGIKL